MQIDIDQLYKDVMKLKLRVEPLLSELEELVAMMPALQALATQKPKAVVELPSVAGGKDRARELLQTGDLDAAGAALGLHRATKASGHAFDETNESFGKRLMADLYGAEAANAELAQPPAAGSTAPAPDEFAPKPLGESEQFAATEKLEEQQPVPAMTSSESSPEVIAALGDPNARPGAEGETTQASQS